MIDDNAGNEEQAEEVEQEENNFETEAREMGWVEQEKFKGAKEKWVDAKEFYERGEHVFPIVKATNKRLKNDLLTRDREIATLKEAVESSQKAIKALQKTYEESTKKQVEQAKIELREQIKAAREIGDTDTELDLQDRMVELRKAESEAKKEEVQEAALSGLTPEFISWQKENSWFGDTSSEDNIDRSNALLKIGRQLTAEKPTLTGRAFMVKCLELLEEKEAGTPQKTVSKVEGGTAGGRTSSASGFASLPKDVKDACHEDNDSFVGPGPDKMFKTIKEWETHFYNTYMES